MNIRTKKKERKTEMKITANKQVVEKDQGSQAYRGSKWWDTHLNKGDQIVLSYMDGLGDSHVKKTLYFGGIEKVEIVGISPVDYLLFYADKDQVGNKGIATPVLPSNVLKIFSIREKEFIPNTNFKIRNEEPEKEPEKSEEPVKQKKEPTPSTEEEIQSSSPRKLRSHVHDIDLAREYIRLRKDIEAQESGKESIPQKELSRMLMRIEKIRGEAIQKENVLVFKDGSIITPDTMKKEFPEKSENSELTLTPPKKTEKKKEAAPDSSPEMDTEEKNTVSKGSNNQDPPEKKTEKKTPRKKTGGNGKDPGFEITEKEDGKFYCPCKKGYGKKAHAIYHHKNHLKAQAKKEGRTK